MKAFTTHSGLVVPLDRPNVDTDQIIPKQFLKSIRRTGFGDNLFDGWRYVDEGSPEKTLNERQLNAQFVLNQPRYQGATILLARDNFGCGSSREHAVWALMEYGIAVVIAPSFADIFYSNCFKNGLLPVVLNEEIVSDLFARATSAQGLTLAVDLHACTVTVSGTTPPLTHGFTLDERRRHKLLNGLDDIGLSLALGDDIRAFEQRHYTRFPWLPGNRALEELR